AAQLPGQHRIEALDALGGVAVGDRLDLERMQFAEVRDLIERKRGVLDQPDGGRLRHQRRTGHGKISSMLRPPVGAKPLSSKMTEKCAEYMQVRPRCPIPRT